MFLTTEEADQLRGPVAPAWGQKNTHASRASHVDAGIEYQGTTVQLCGMYPFVAGSGSPIIGVPMGQHLHWGEVVCLDPIGWLRAGIITNPGMFVLGRPGTGKSTIVKRLITGMTAFGTQTLILGDTKPDYTPLVEHLGGQVIRVGRGLDRINPLDSGPLGAALRTMEGSEAQRLTLEVRGRRLALMQALCTLVRGAPLNNAEEIILGAALDTFTENSEAEPTVPELVRIIDEGSERLLRATRSETHEEYRRVAREVTYTLDQLCNGSLQGIFDGPTSTHIDLDAPIVSVDISNVAAAGDVVVAAAMLCVWAYGFAVVDAAAVLADHGLAPRRQFLGVMDELWRALRGAAGLVEHADALTRLNRQRGMASVMVTHSLQDLEALPTEEDRAKARGFAERCSITVLAGLPQRELRAVSEIVPLTEPEIDLVKSWDSPETWQAGNVHPGRGKYLIKTGERLGIPVALTLVGDEAQLYDTDAAIREGK